MRSVLIKALVRLYKLVYNSDLRSTRFLLGLAEVLWAFALFSPEMTFHIDRYEAMLHVMPENLWGSVFLLFGVTNLLALALGGCKAKWMVPFSGLNTILWCFVVLSLCLDRHSSYADMAGNIVMVVAASWLFLRSGLPNSGRRSTDGLFGEFTSI